MTHRALACLLACLLAPHLEGDEQPLDFHRDIRPILSDHCLRCHGPDPEARQGGVRFDVEEGLRLEKRGRPVVGSDRTQSILWERIRHPDPEERMPPLEAKAPLDAREIELLGRWIDAGAPWTDHWAFARPERPALPAVADRSRVRNAIDHFTLAKLESLGLTFSPDADRRSFIRRASFDVRGLPPSPEEVEHFLADTGPEAYESLVDRLLASERYGERMTLAWMDAARYGDSSVYHADGPRFMWPWRDWVIRAYNENMPFDRFTVEQLAGDLIPEATVSQKVASGFHRNHGTTDEGGAIDEEYRVEYIVDRVKTTATVWLGLTMECAQCHDHKYDPVSQREYYRFYAYFNQAKDRGMQTRNGNAPPFVSVLPPGLEADVKARKTELAALEAERAGLYPPAAEFDGWLERERALKRTVPTFGEWFAIGPFSNAKPFDEAFGPEGETLASGLDKRYGKLVWKPRKDLVDGKVLNLALPQNSAIYFRREVEVSSPTSLGLSLGSDDGIQVWLDGEHKLAKNVGRGVAPDQESLPLELSAGKHLLVFKVNNGGGGSGFYFRAGADPVPAELRALLARGTEKPLTAEETAKLRSYYAESIWDGRKALDGRIATVKKAIGDLEKSVPTSMILEDVENGRDTYLLMRGHYASPRKDEVLKPGVPAFLPPLPATARADRLGLAEWIVRDDHPLTARVAVNRYWNLLFGHGLVATLGDFGTRSDSPSHPELLDWLAREFVETGYDVKGILRLILASTTYRQSSHTTPELLAKDPRNRFHSRGPRRRLEGEFIRDQALALAGLLNDRVGGPSVKPYQPPGIWNEVSLNGNLRYQRDAGDKLYRRSMYTYWKRSAPSPSLMAFDVPTREKCVVQRQVTNTPLQALVTLNDVQFVEAARVFATRVLRESGWSFAARLDRAFELATARPADALRHAVLAELYASELARFRAAPEKATALLGFGETPRPEDLDPAELAAWTIVTSAILNLDEVLTKE